MILTDANLLLYAYNVDAAQHDTSRRWLETQLSGSELFCFAWQTITAFLRISTNQRAFAAPFSIKTATTIVTEWLERPQAVLLTPGEKHWVIFQNLLEDEQATGPLVMDAHLAALALEHGAALASSDRDFSRFPGLKLINPLRG
ncbi:MAG TPA: type II toxin-antitoxin system VapC family toxin [Pyrinomonadaceae bacterium]|nr:type II toxin-antitoxin system VapC family toxin [Pyrinomonadaceae bacterium]